MSQSSLSYEEKTRSHSKWGNWNYAGAAWSVRGRATESRASPGVWEPDTGVGHHQPTPHLCPSICKLFSYCCGKAFVQQKGKQHGFHCEPVRANPGDRVFLPCLCAGPHLATPETRRAPIWDMCLHCESQAYASTKGVWVGRQVLEHTWSRWG